MISHLLRPHAGSLPKVRKFVTLGNVLYVHFGVLDLATGKHCTCRSSVRFLATSFPRSSTVAGNCQFGNGLRSNRMLLDGSFWPAGLFHGLQLGIASIRKKHRHASEVAVLGRTTCATEYIRLVCPPHWYSYILVYPPKPDCQSRGQ